MRTIAVRCANASYNILVGVGVFENLETHLHEAGFEPPFLVISQPRILRAIGQRIKKTFPIAVIPDGERAKTLATVSRLLDRMVDMKLTRQSTVIAVSGGVAGDVAGFVASICMRCIRVVHARTQVPGQ